MEGATDDAGPRRGFAMLVATENTPTTEHTEDTETEQILARESREPSRMKPERTPFRNSR